MQIAAFLVLFGLTTALSAMAERRFVERIPNAGNVPGAFAIGHPDGTGDNHINNEFGAAFSNGGLQWTVALCQADSDGDGQTNGQELGDSCCEWTQSSGMPPRRTEGISHPSNKSFMSDPRLWADINCSSVNSTALLSSSRSQMRQTGLSLVLAIFLSIAMTLSIA